MASVACWLVGCSADADSHQPDTDTHTIVFNGLGDASQINDVVVLLFDSNNILTDIYNDRRDLPGGTTLSLSAVPEGSKCFAAVNTAGTYRLYPENLTPGIRAADITFKSTDSRADETGTVAFCGAAVKGDTQTRIDLEPMTGAVITLKGWIVTEVTPGFK